MTDHQLIMVTWTDAAHHSPGEWCNPYDIDPEVTVTTVGFHLQQTVTHLLVAQSFTSEGWATGVFSIPVGNILDWQIIETLDQNS